MIRSILLSLLAAAALRQDDPVAAEALKGYTHPWTGFGMGSTVTYRETMRRPEIDKKGSLVHVEIASEVVWTVTDVSGQKVTIRIEGGGQESTFPHFTGLPAWSRGKGERKGDEELAAGDRKLACRRTAITLDTDKDAGQVTTIWRSEQVPYWAVRRRTETILKGKVFTSEEELLLEVEEKVKVGDREVSCAVVEVTTEAVGAPRTVKKEWRSDEVPGRLVRRVTRHYRDGKEVESSSTKMDVVRFQAKR